MNVWTHHGGRNRQLKRITTETESAGGWHSLEHFEAPIAVAMFLYTQILEVKYSVRASSIISLMERLSVAHRTLVRILRFKGEFVCVHYKISKNVYFNPTLLLKCLDSVTLRHLTITPCHTSEYFLPVFTVEVKLTGIWKQGRAETIVSGAGSGVCVLTNQRWPGIQVSQIKIMKLKMRIICPL